MANNVTSSLESILGLVPCVLDYIDCTEDLAFIQEIKEKSRLVDEARKRELEEVSYQVNGLTLKLNLAQETVKQLKATHESEQYMGKIIELGRNQLNTEKTTQDIEKAIGDMEEQYRLMTEEMNRLEEEERTLRNQPPPAAGLKLNIYRKLGVDMIEDARGHFSSCQVRSPIQNDIHTVEFDPQYSQFFYANYIWELAST